jgi:hypothetical protein
MLRRAERFSEDRVHKAETTTVGIRHAEHVAPSPQKLALTLLKSEGRSVAIVHSWTQATEFRASGSARLGSAQLLLH